MALINVGVNSWVTLIEANDYFAARWGDDAVSWLALADVEKEKSLITAFKWLSSDPNYELSPTDTSQYLKDAQCETALFLFETYNEYRKRENIIASGISKFEYGQRWKEELSKTKKPSSVSDLLDKGGFSQEHIIYNLCD